MTPKPPAPQPLAKDQGVAVLHEVLGATIHLEKLALADQDLLDEVNDLAFEWLGAHLKQTWATFLEDVEPFERRQLDYIPGQVDCLRDVAQGALPRYQLGKLHEFGVSANGGSEQLEASPFSYRFWMESPSADTYPVLRLTVPTDWPLEDFTQHVLDIAGRLRVRSASIGYTYSTWFVVDFEIAAAKLAAHARRHVGFDVGYFIGNTEVFYRKLRTVNWITLLGESLEEEWRAGGAPTLEVERAGAHALLRASETPQRGDRNRLDYPRGYQQLDAALRHIRATEVDQPFIGPWTGADVPSWLRRFELSLQ